MHKRPLVIALGIAGIIAGTHAGIAAISTEGTVAAPAAPQTGPQVVVESQTPQEANLVVQAPVENQTPATATPQASTPTGTPLQTAVNTADDEYQLRIPFTSRTIKVKVATFPGNSQEFADPAPSVVAYFDRRNANTQLAGAPGPVFPSGSDEFAPVSPAVVAHFDRQEARRLAAAAPAAPAAPATPTVTANTTEAVTVAAAPPAPVAGN